MAGHEKMENGVVDLRLDSESNYVGQEEQWHPGPEAREPVRPLMPEGPSMAPTAPSRISDHFGIHCHVTRYMMQVVSCASRFNDKLVKDLDQLNTTASFLHHASRTSCELLGSQTSKALTSDDESSSIPVQLTPCRCFMRYLINGLLPAALYT